MRRKRRAPERKTPLARGAKELKRTPFEGRSQLGRGTKRLPAQSAKRRQQRPARDDVRRRTIERASGRCEGAALWPEIACWGPLDVDEAVGRGVRPGAHLDAAVTQLVCRAHHEACGQSSPQRAEAERRGMRYSAWDYDRAVTEMAARPNRIR